MSSSDQQSPDLVSFGAPVLVAGRSHAIYMSEDGEIEQLSPLSARSRLNDEMVLVCHAPETLRKMGIPQTKCLDLLELFAFVRPAAFTTPTAKGIASVLGLQLPTSLEREALVVLQAAQRLLQELSTRGPNDHHAGPLAWHMHQAGWPWAIPVLRTLGHNQGFPENITRRSLRVWDRLKEWEDMAPRPPASSHGINELDSLKRLTELLENKREVREGQRAFAVAASGAFAPRQEEFNPNVVIAEAGTGVGKTLGYIAPASLWAEKNKAPVWLSTYTRNLQRQIDQELDNLYPSRQEKEAKVVIRKGRENYLCLLNFEDAVQSLASSAQDAISQGLLVRWIDATRNGELVSGDLPGWLVDLLGTRQTLELADRRGECIYSACQHYRKCFIEKSVRASKTAQLVIANHALVMNQTNVGGDESTMPTRYVFDEGHHIFDAADSAFGAHLTMAEGQEMRRWLLGNETGGRRASRSGGIQLRLRDLVEQDAKLVSLIQEIVEKSKILPAPGWLNRLSSGASVGPYESFLASVGQQVYARSEKSNDLYSIECEPHPLNDGILERAKHLDMALTQLLDPLKRLKAKLTKLLADEADSLDSDKRRRIDGLLTTMENRALMGLEAWRAMLKSLEERQTPEEFIDWFSVERFEGRDYNMGYFRHYVDPTKPFMASLRQTAHGVLFTSATLRDQGAKESEDWRAAEEVTGARYLDLPALHSLHYSPFAYQERTKVIIINDVRKDDMDQVASAYRELFQASGGGGLGLFTAISRLKAVHERIAAPLEANGINLFAQHVDRIGISTLIEMFRSEQDSCLLGTDAVRDGVDVPGNALRLIVFDRVPWPRPSIAHKARREAFGGRIYDERLVRLKLRQAFGRLIRQSDDKGVFVLLDSMMPSRLKSAFPEGVTFEKIGLRDAMESIRSFLRT
jgi:ATP-dependent DNA helicase DinG